jgi:hypothetical protein
MEADGWCIHSHPYECSKIGEKSRLRRGWWLAAQGSREEPSPLGRGLVEIEIRQCGIAWVGGG